MQTPYSVEELVINDSFINYCKGNNEADIARWENYLLFFPEEKDKIEEARRFVAGIAIMLKQKEQSDALSELKASVASLEDNDEVTVYQVSSPRLNRFRKYIPYAAALLLIGTALFFLTNSKNVSETLVQASPVEKDNIPTLLFQTAYGEKKEVWLPDSSRVILNAGSTLRIDSIFGQTARKVYLTGEALFDVTHNKALPFSVSVRNFEVKVLGTVFNVKAYPSDKEEIASLIKGKIELVMKGQGSKSFILQPNEKAVVPNIPVNHAEIRLASGTDKSPLITGVNYNVKDSSIVETSWAYNRFDIYNRKFVEIQADLERLYNVKISFKDNAVANYRFSVTFENETIEQILQALQLSYPFHYSIENENITISK